MTSSFWLFYPIQKSRQYESLGPTGCKQKKFFLFIYKNRIKIHPPASESHTLFSKRSKNPGGWMPPG